MKTRELRALSCDIDDEAKKAHIASCGGDIKSIQGWDCQYTIEPGGILRVDGHEIDLSKATREEAEQAIRGCYAVLDCV